MSEPAEVVPAALVPIVKVGELVDMVKEGDKPIFNAMSNMEGLDWKKLKPNQMAVLLMQRPMSISGGGTTYLTFKQAMVFALRSFELGVSPLSGAVWFDPAKFSVNLTLEGKREVARNRGIDLGPPNFVEVSRDWKDIAKKTPAVEEVIKAGYAKDIGMVCKIRVGKPEYKEYSEYTAWLSEWYQPKSPVWRDKPMHMLQTRAQEKAITLALGTGASSMPDEMDL